MIKKVMYVMGAILAGLLIFGNVVKTRMENDCKEDKARAEQAVQMMEFSAPSLEQNAFRVRMHNKSPFDVFRDFTFYVYLEDCVNGACARVGSGTYYVRGGRRNIIFSGEAEDVTATPILGSGVPEVRPQGELRYSYELVSVGVGKMYTGSCW